MAKYIVSYRLLAKPEDANEILYLRDVIAQKHYGIYTDYREANAKIKELVAPYGKLVEQRHVDSASVDLPDGRVIYVRRSDNLTDKKVEAFKKRYKLEK